MDDRVFKIKSRDSGKLYEVTLSSGKWRCTCPHWQFRLRGKAACKHIEEAKTFDERQARIQDEAEHSIDWGDWFEMPHKPDADDDEN